MVRRGWQRTVSISINSGRVVITESTEDIYRLFKCRMSIKVQYKLCRYTQRPDLIQLRPQKTVLGSPMSLSSRRIWHGPTNRRGWVIAQPSTRFGPYIYFVDPHWGGGPTETGFRHDTPADFIGKRPPINSRVGGHTRKRRGLILYK